MEIIIIFATVAVLIMAVVVFFIVSVLKFLKKLSSLEEYEVGGYKITSITKVVGKRKVTTFSTVTNRNNANITKKYTYESKDCANSDIEKYVKYLGKYEDFSLGEYKENSGKVSNVAVYKLVGIVQITVEMYYDVKGYTICVSALDN